MTVLYQHGTIRPMSSKKRVSDVALLPVWGARIARARKALGVMQKDVAADTGIEFKTLSNWEKGHAPPSPWFLCKFEQLYGIDPNYILCGKLSGLPEDIARKIRELSDGQR